MATGAFNVSFSDGSDPYFRRGGRMLTATAMGAIAVVIGSLLGSHDAAAITLAALWAFAAGMLVAFDNAAGDIGLISLVTLVVFSAHSLPPEQAVSSGLLAFGGGILQTALSLALWPLRRHEPERRLVGELYLALSNVAAAPVNASAPPPVTSEISQARKMLSGIGRGRSIQAERYWSLVSQAERIRLSLLIITRLGVRLGREPGTEAHTETIDQVRELATRVLREISDELLDGGNSVINPESMMQLTQLTDAYRHREHQSQSSATSALASEARLQLDALAGQLRAAADLAAYSTPSGRQVFERGQSQNPWKFRVAGSVAILRANLSLQSAAFRHALRLAACVGIGEGLARMLSWQRSYWLPMTVAIILKPDFTATLSRGVLRLAGTAAGLLLATALFHALALTPVMEVVILAGIAFVLRCYGPANYGIFVTASVRWSCCCSR